LIENLGVLDKCFEFIKSIEVTTMKKPDCLRGLALTLRGIGHLIKDLRQEGYQYVLTRNLQQDDLENLFSVLRMKGGWSKNPTSREFRHNFKFVFIKSFLKRSSSSNCRDKVSENISFDLTLLSALFESKISSEHEADSVVSFISESELQELCGVDVQGKALSCPNVPFFDSYEMGLQGGMVSKNNAIYIGGYCAKTITKKFDCNDCKALLCENINEKNESHI
jgi:hypothetical protein